MAVAWRGRCFREGRAGELEYRILAADGRVVWFRESMRRRAATRGRPRVLRGCLWDIGRRKKVERQLYTDAASWPSTWPTSAHLYLLGGRLLATSTWRALLEEILGGGDLDPQGAEMGAVRLLDRDRGELEAVVSLGLRRSTSSGSAGCQVGDGGVRAGRRLRAGR